MLSRINKEEKKEPSALDKFLEGIKTGGISVIVDYIKPHLSGLGGEVIKETIQSLIPGLIAQGVAKLAMMANPVGGIVAAIKGVWDLIQFFRSNFEAMAGLGSALLGVLVNAANGDPGAAANAVEAALCQAIPLAIDLITRLIGINVGKRVKDIVARISKKIRGVIDKLINKLNRSKLGKKFTQVTGKKISTFKEREQSKEAKEAREKQQAEDTRRVREREASLSDNKIAAAASSMGNRGTQLSDYVSDKKKAQSNKVFNVTGLTGALKGEKEGDLGVNLDNSEYVTTTSERNAQKIDHYFENRKAEKLRLAELEAQKKRIAETHENGDNGEGGVRAVEELSAVNGIETESQSALIATEENQEDNSEIKEREDQDQSQGKGENRSIPQGISLEQFERLSQTVRDRFINISQDIRVQGSRAAWTAREDSDIDIAVLVSPEKFDALIEQYFKTPNPGSSREKTKMWAREKGKIQAGEARAHALREELKRMLNMKVDVSIIKIGGEFDNPPYISLK